MEWWKCVIKGDAEINTSKVRDKGSSRLVCVNRGYTCTAYLCSPSPPHPPYTHTYLWVGKMSKWKYPVVLMCDWLFVENTTL